MFNTPIRPRLTLGLLGVAVTALLALAGSASASTVSCGGTLSVGQAPKTLTYDFRCSDPILGYTISFDQEVDGFEPEVPVLDVDQNATNELMTCEGDIPGFGIGCFGGYSASGRKIKGTVDLPRKVCADPRYKATLFAVVGAKGQTAGPFDFYGPTDCGHQTSQLDKLIAWVKLLRRELAKG